MGRQTRKWLAGQALEQQELRGGYPYDPGVWQAITEGFWGRPQPNFSGIKVALLFIDFFRDQDPEDLSNSSDKLSTVIHFSPHLHRCQLAILYESASLARSLAQSCGSLIPSIGGRQGLLMALSIHRLPRACWVHCIPDPDPFLLQYCSVGSVSSLPFER